MKLKFVVDMGYIKGFNGLRAISLAMVILTHLGVYDKFPKADFFNTRLIYLFNGTTGVNIFFTISGFLITSLLLHEKKLTGTVNVKHFYIRRILRLAPAFTILLLILIALKVQDKTPVPAMGIFFFIFYIYNFIPRKSYTGELGHTWSLAVEEQFYLLWPLILANFGYKAALRFSLFILLLCFAMKLFVSGQMMTVGDEFTRLFELYFIDRWFIPAATPIMIGSITALLYFNHEDQLRRAVKQGGLFLALIFFLFPTFISQPLIIYSMFPQSIAFGTFLLWIIFNQNSVIVKIAETKALYYTGLISYGLYIYQGVFLRTGPNGVLGIQQFPVNLILTVCLAILSFYLIEKKFLKLKKRYSLSEQNGVLS